MLRVHPAAIVGPAQICLSIRLRGDDLIGGGIQGGGDVVCIPRRFPPIDFPGGKPPLEVYEVSLYGKDTSYQTGGEVLFGFRASSLDFMLCLHHLGDGSDQALHHRRGRAQQMGTRISAKAVQPVSKCTIWNFSSGWISWIFGHSSSRNWFGVIREVPMRISHCPVVRFWPGPGRPWHTGSYISRPDGRTSRQMIPVYRGGFCLYNANNGDYYALNA